MEITNFRKLHVPGRPFVLANAWDKGSAKMLAALGAKAIASTSAGHAFTIGERDMGHVTREVAISHAVGLCEATPLPVNGDLEDGYGATPDEVALTVRLAAQSGMAGCGIEDEMFSAGKAYDFSVAVERIEAAAAEAKNADHDFVLTARADGIMNGHYDVSEAIKRLKEFERAGADVLYAPMPASFEDLKLICTSLEAPVNVLAAGQFSRNTVADFANAGAARISLGSALASVTHAAIRNSAKAIFENGDFSSFENGMSGGEVEALFDRSNQLRD